MGRSSKAVLAQAQPFFPCVSLLFSFFLSLLLFTVFLTAMVSLFAV